MTQRIYDYWQIAGMGQDPSKTVQGIRRSDLRRDPADVYAERRARPGGDVKTDGVIVWGGHGHTLIGGLLEYSPRRDRELVRWRKRLDSFIADLPGRVIWYYGDPVTEPDPVEIRRSILERASAGCDAVVFDHTAHEPHNRSWIRSVVDPWRHALRFGQGRTMELGIEPASMPGGVTLDFSMFIAHGGVGSPWWRLMVGERVAPSEAHEVIAVMRGGETGLDDWRHALDLGYSIAINAGGIGKVQADELNAVRAELIS